MRQVLGIHDRQLDPRSPSNPSNQSYMMLFLPSPPPRASRAFSSAPVLQFRGEETVRAAAGFLASALAGAAPGSTAPDGSWIALAFDRKSASTVRDKLRLLAGAAGSCPCSRLSCSLPPGCSCAPPYVFGPPAAGCDGPPSQLASPRRLSDASSCLPTPTPILLARDFSGVRVANCRNLHMP